MNYFNGLRYNNIDIRPELAAKITENWTFLQPRQNAATWHYYLYLASLDTPKAYEALEDKLATTLSGNDATNLINSLAELKTAKTKAILVKYLKDTRHADTPDGPGLTIAETVSSLLATGFQSLSELEQ